LLNFEALESGPDWVHLRWEPAAVRHHATGAGRGTGGGPQPIGYLLEVLQQLADEDDDSGNNKQQWTPLVTEQVKNNFFINIFAI
jgi:hypothetical protein